MTGEIVNPTLSNFCGYTMLLSFTAVVVAAAIAVCVGIYSFTKTMLSL